MFTKFWEGIAEGLASEWTARVVGPALFFWGGGIMAWGYCYGWGSFLAWLNAQNIVTYLILATGGVLLLAVSTAAMGWVQLPLLRFLEGYWPGKLGGRLRFAIARQVAKRLARKEARWQVLANRESNELSPEERDEYAQLDVELAAYPVEAADLLPTSIGNFLRSAESYSRLRYGLEITVVWPRLWLLLSEGNQKEINIARQRLNETTEFFGWSVLFAIWTIWAWWAFPISIGLIVVAWWRLTNVAGVYGDLLRAAFDLHRFALYEQLRWPIPSEPTDEKSHGQQLSEYLFRGTGGDKIHFTVQNKNRFKPK